MIQSLLSSYVSTLNIIYSIVFEDPLVITRYLQLELVALTVAYINYVQPC